MKENLEDYDDKNSSWKQNAARKLGFILKQTKKKEFSIFSPFFISLCVISREKEFRIKEVNNFNKTLNGMSL